MRDVDFVEGGAEFGESGSGGRADGDDWRVFEERVTDEFFDFKTGEIEDVLIDEVGFGDRDDASGDGKEAADIEVLACLRLDGFVGGDDQEDGVDAGGSGEHVLDETLVAGDVDETDVAEMSEAEVDGDAAAFFFLKTVGVDAGEGSDERCLAVIDVSCCADDERNVCVPLLIFISRSLDWIPSWQW